MAWNPDDPFLAAAALGETDSGIRNLPDFVCSLLQPGPALVIGASEVVLRAAEDRHVVAVDWSSRRLATLEDAARERGVGIRLFCRDPDREDLGVARRSVRNAVCLDGLEFFRDDVGVLEKLHEALAPGGTLVVRVRACPWVRQEAGRLPVPPRHYDPDVLRDALADAGFRTLRIRHWNFLGVPAAFLWDRCLGRPQRHRGGAPASERSRGWWDSMLDLWYRTVENRVGFPYGVSLVAVATPHLEKARVESRAASAVPVPRPAHEAYEASACAPDGV
jgi:SAM-dependent methyltransferase